VPVFSGTSLCSTFPSGLDDRRRVTGYGSERPLYHFFSCLARGCLHGHRKLGPAMQTLTRPCLSHGPHKRWVHQLRLCIPPSSSRFPPEFRRIRVGWTRTGWSWWPGAAQRPFARPTGRVQYAILGGRDYLTDLGTFMPCVGAPVGAKIDHVDAPLESAPSPNRYNQGRSEANASSLCGRGASSRLPLVGDLDVRWANDRLAS